MGRAAQPSLLLLLLLPLRFTFTTLANSGRHTKDLREEPTVKTRSSGVCLHSSNSCTVSSSAFSVCTLIWLALTSARGGILSFGTPGRRAGSWRRSKGPAAHRCGTGTRRRGGGVVCRGGVLVSHFLWWWRRRPAALEGGKEVIVVVALEKGREKDEERRGVFVLTSLASLDNRDGRDNRDVRISHVRLDGRGGWEGE